MAPASFSFKENLTPDEEKLFVAGLMLYFGEGAKTRSTVDLANSNPEMLKLFIAFLRTIFRIDESKVRIYLYCYSNQNVSDLINFWSQELSVSKNLFTRPYVRDHLPSNKRFIQYGVAHVRYNDKRLLEKILSLCSSLVVELLQNVGRYSSGQRGQTVKGSS